MIRPSMTASGRCRQQQLSAGGRSSVWRHDAAAAAATVLPACRSCARPNDASTVIVSCASHSAEHVDVIGATQGAALSLL